MIKDAEEKIRFVNIYIEEMKKEREIEKSLNKEIRDKSCKITDMLINSDISLKELRRNLEEINIDFFE